MYLSIQNLDFNEKENVLKFFEALIFIILYIFWTAIFDPSIRKYANTFAISRWTLISVI